MNELIQKIPWDTVGKVAAILGILGFLYGIVRYLWRRVSGKKDVEEKVTDLQKAVRELETRSAAKFYLNGIPANKLISELVGNALEYLKSYKYEEAVEGFEKAISLSKKDSEKCALRISIGNVFYSQSQLTAAEEHYLQALALAEKVQDDREKKEGKAAALGNIGLIYRAKGDLEQALKYQKEALKIHKEIGYRQGEANQLGNIGLVYQVKGDPAEALKYHEAA